MIVFGMCGGLWLVGGCWETLAAFVGESGN